MVSAIVEIFPSRMAVEKKNFVCLLHVCWLACFIASFLKSAIYTINLHRCVCDANDEVWRMDNGTIVGKHKLPVIGVITEDTDDEKEQAYFSLGPLMCAQEKTGLFWGSKEKLF